MRPMQVHIKSINWFSLEKDYTGCGAYIVVS